MPRRPAGSVAALALLGLVLVLASCADADAGAARVDLPANRTGYAGALLDVAYAKPTQSFTDTAGRTFSWSLTKPVTIVFFGYTHCPDECPTTMADLSSALRRIDPAVRAKVDVVVVTTDPARDTGPVLRRWLDRFDRSFIGLIGSTAAVRGAASRLAVAVESPTEHGTALIGFRGEQGLLVWTKGTSVRDLRADIERLAR